MATNFPTSVDVLTNPVSNDSLNSPSHSTQHTNANDAIEAIEAAIISPVTYPNQLVNGTTATVRPLPFAISCNFINVSSTNGIGAGPWSGGFFGNASVTFPASRFTSAPVLTVSMNEGTGAQSGFVTFSSVTSSGFAVTSITQASGTAGVNWQAIQMISAGGGG